MFFYTVIFLVCLIAAVIIAWLYRLTSSIGTTIRKTKSSRSESGPTGHVDANKDVSAAWDVKSRNARGTLAKTHAGRSKFGYEIGEDNSYYGPRDKYAAPLHAKVQLQSAGWLHREDKTELHGSVYKVTRRLKVREKNPKYVSKPASWS